MCTTLETKQGCNEQREGSRIGMHGRNAHSVIDGKWRDRGLRDTSSECRWSSECMMLESEDENT